MLYEKYQRRIIKISAIKKWIKRHRISIITVATIFFALLTAFLSVKGVVYKSGDIPSVITYGESMPYSANALFGKVTYEYAAEGTEDWTQAQPLRTGSYRVRARSKRIFGAANYSEPQSFKILPKAIDVTVSPDTVKYGEEIPISAELMFEDSINCEYFLYQNIGNNKAQVTADEKAVKISDKQGNDVTESYKINVVSKEIKLFKRDITVTVQDATVVYDGTALSFDGCDVSKGSLAKGDNLIATFDKALVDAGEIENTAQVKIASASGINVTDLYDINVVSGKLTVEKRPVYIKTFSDEKLYDGEPLSNFKYELTTPLVEGHKLEFLSGASLTNAGSCENLLVFKVTDGENDVTKNYSFLFSQDSKLKITPISLTIKTADASKTYDGLPLTNFNYTIESAAKPLSNHLLSLTFSGMQRRAGNSYNTVNKAVITEDGINVTQNYSLEYINGVLSVAPRSISVRTATAEFVYNGKAQFNGTTEITSTVKLAGGDALRAISPTLITNIGNATNRFSVKIVDVDGSDVSDSYIVSYNYGTLTMNKSSIEVTTDSKDLIYNGAFQSSGGHSAIPSVAEGQISRAKESTLTYLKEVERLGDGSFKQVVNKFEVAIFSGETDVTYNYDISYVYGTLKMLPQAVVVTTDSQEFIYNGKDQFNDSFSLGSNIVDGHLPRLKGSTMPVLKNVERLQGGGFKRYFNIFEIEIFSDNTIVSSNYDISYVYGTLTMLPRPVTVSTASNVWIYDGIAHSDRGVSIKEGSLVEGHSATAIIGTLTFATNVIRLEDGTIASIQNRFKIDILSGEETVAYNYDISYEYGTLTINPRSITVTTNTNSWIYDANAHKDTGFTVTAGNIVSGHNTVLTEYTSIIDVIRLNDGIVGSTENVIALNIFNITDNVTYNYEINYTYGTLTITPRLLEITTNSNTWVYDGLSHKDSGFTITHGTLAKNTHVPFVTSPIISLVNVDVKENIFEVGIFFTSDVGNLTSNYDIRYVYGYISVIPRPITIELVDRLKSYDGYPLSSTEYIIKSGTIVEGQYAKILCNGFQTEIGISDNIIESFMIFFGEENVTSNYNITKINGTLEVLKRNVFIYADNASKIYDGMPLTCKTFTTDNLLSWHKLTAKTLGSQTEVGIGRNIVIRDSVRITSNGLDVLSYYNLIFSDGELQVDLKKLTLKTGSAEKEYDGTPLKDGRYEIIGELLSQQTAEVYVTGSRTSIGTNNNYATIYIRDKNGKYVTYCYLITYELGKLTVTGDTGGSDINTDGSIDRVPPGGGSGKENILFKARSTTSDKVYFRVKSFGDYTVDGWENGMPYLKGNINALQLMYHSLNLSGKPISNISIETVSQNLSYMLPYYAQNGYVTLDDTRINTTYGSPYYIDYVPYTFKESDRFSVNGSGYEAYEREYYDFVRNNYLQLPESTRTKLLEIAAKNSLNPSSDTLITDVTNLVQNYVKYSLNYNEYLGDIAVYFFTKAETGICQHYATAATAMLRALGIPARYAIGFVGNMSAGKEIEVSAAQAHAWVEVYLPQAGWVQIEVTGSGDGSGGGSGEGGGGEGGIEIKELKIKPLDLNKMYDGTPLIAKNEIVGADLDALQILQFFIESGYRYTAIVTGSQTELGISESHINDFILYDNYGRNVTENYKISYFPGRLRVTHTPIYINLYSLEKHYDGTPLAYESQDYWVEGLPDGYRLNFNLSGSLTEAGMLNLYELENLPYTVYNKYYNDVTNLYSLVFVGKPLRIHKRVIEITSASVTKTYDGTELKSDASWISKGTILPTHVYKVLFNASIIDIGFTDNMFLLVSIKDNNGIDVTKNYQINKIYGILKIESN